MPIYEYECGECGEKFEMRRSINDRDEKVKCPKCGTKGPRRVISLFGTSASDETSGGSCAPRGGFT